MKKQNFDALEKILEEKRLPDDCRPTTFQIAMHAILTKDADKFSEVAKQFVSAVLEHQFLHLHPQQIISNIEDIKFMICKNNKSYDFKSQQYRGYLIFGKAVCVYKRKKNRQVQQLEHKEEFISLIEQGMIRLYQDNSLILQKPEKNFTLNDILLQHDMPDAETDQVVITNEILSPFVPIQRSIVMLIPSKSYKPQCLSFLKSSLLHIYLDQAALVSKIITKESFYKNSSLRGIYFIEEGEIEVHSGRLMARGWTTNGRVKVSGFGWKFKPIPFIRFLAKNPLIWKQFINDLKLNHEYPYNIIHILGLNDQDDFTKRAEWRGLGRKKLGNKSNRLPKIMNKSVDDARYGQIEKLKHYDNRMNDIFVYKQDLLTRKLKGVVHGKFQPFYKDQKAEKSAERKRNMLQRMNSKKSQQFSKRQTQPDYQPTQNILIMSVLKRLQSIADLEQAANKRKNSLVSRQLSPSQNYRMMVMKSQSRKQGTKITPMQVHQQIRYAKKNKRYK